MSEVRRPLIPQFSLRWILALTTVMAVVSLVFTQALAGHAWAVGVAILLAALVMAFVVYAATFAAVSLSADPLEALRTRRVGQVRADPPESSAPPPTAALILALLIAAGGRTTFAASGTSITLPVLGPGQINSTGLMLTIDIIWVDSGGYRPVRIEVKSITGPVTADRVLTIRIRPKQYYSAADSVTASQVIEIPAGASKATATISVPAISPWGLFELDTIEDGQFVEQLSIGGKNAAASFSGTFGGAPSGDGASPMILLLNGDNNSLNVSLRSINPQLELFPVGGTVSQPSSAPFAPGSVSTTGAFSGLSELPANWIDYSGLDVIVTSLAKFAELEEKNAPQYAAIQNWVRCGGTLIVYGIDSDWHNLDRLNSLVAFDGDRTDDSADNAALRDWVAPRWRLNGSLEMVAVPAAPPFASQPIDPSGGPGGSDNRNVTGDEAEGKASDFVPRGDAPFLTHARDLGMVVAIRSDSPGRNFTANNFAWSWLFNSIGPRRWQWHQRWGVSLYQQNDHFWDFLIPGVGLVPVVQFQVLITLFVIVIGPVNYYLFKRLGKLNLMVLTVPAGALAITSALLVYALLADGFSVRVRARSFTQIDQRTGRAECWTRLSYYAGLSPSGGLTFSQDTAVIPLLAWPAEMQNDPARTLVWVRTNPADANSALEQRLTEGWLKSRTPTQFITARVHKTTARLNVKPVGSGSPPQVTNYLGTPIKWLFIVDEDGNCFTANAVAAGALASLSPIESQSEAGAGHFQRLLAENQPQPPDIRGSDGRSVFGLYQSARTYAQPLQYGAGNAVYNQLGGSGPPLHEQDSGTLERELFDLVQQMIKEKLPPKTYIAVVESSPEVELGTPSAREEASFHVIRGEW